MRSCFISLRSSIVIGACLVTAASAQFDRPRAKLPSDAISPKPEQEAKVDPAADPPVRYVPSAEQKNLAEAGGIRDIDVDAEETTASFTFRARSGGIPTVEFSDQPPVSGRGGDLQFKSRLGTANAQVVFDKKALAQTNFKANLSELERDSRYFYIITVPGSDGTGSRQIQGQFKTKQSLGDVKIVFTEIHVNNDSDANSNGDLVFDFSVNGNRFSAYGSAKELLNWSDEDPARQINESTELRGVADTFRVSVFGCDDDSTIGPNGCGFRFATETPQGNWDSDTNLAQKTFDIREYPGKEVRHEFVLNSMPQSGGQGDLSFSVKGYFVITRR